MDQGASVTPLGNWGAQYLTHQVILQIKIVGPKADRHGLHSRGFIKSAGHCQDPSDNLSSSLLFSKPVTLVPLSPPLWIEMSVLIHRNSFQVTLCCFWGGGES